MSQFTPINKLAPATPLFSSSFMPVNAPTLATGAIFTPYNAPAGPLPGPQPNLDINTNLHLYTSVPTPDELIIEDEDMGDSDWSGTDGDMDVDEDMADDAPTDGESIDNSSSDDELMHDPLDDQHFTTPLAPPNAHNAYNAQAQVAYSQAIQPANSHAVQPLQRGTARVPKVDSKPWKTFLSSEKDHGRGKRKAPDAADDALLDTPAAKKTKLTTGNDRNKGRKLAKNAPKVSIKSRVSKPKAKSNAKDVGKGTAFVRCDFPGLVNFRAAESADALDDTGTEARKDSHFAASTQNAADTSAPHPVNDDEDSSPPVNPAVDPASTAIDDGSPLATNTVADASNPVINGAENPPTPPTEPVTSPESPFAVSKRAPKSKKASPRTETTTDKVNKNKAKKPGWSWRRCRSTSPPWRGSTVIKKAEDAALAELGGGRSMRASRRRNPIASDEEDNDNESEYDKNDDDKNDNAVTPVAPALPTPTPEMRKISKTEPNKGKVTKVAAPSRKKAGGSPTPTARKAAEAALKHGLGSIRTASTSSSESGGTSSITNASASSPPPTTPHSSPTSTSPPSSTSSKVNVGATISSSSPPFRQSPTSSHSPNAPNSADSDAVTINGKSVSRERATKAARHLYFGLVSEDKARLGEAAIEANNACEAVKASRSAIAMPAGATNGDYAADVDKESAGVNDDESVYHDAEPGVDTTDVTSPATHNAGHSGDGGEVEANKATIIDSESPSKSVIGATGKDFLAARSAASLADEADDSEDAMAVDSSAAVFVGDITSSAGSETDLGSPVGDEGIDVAGTPPVTAAEEAYLIGDNGSALIDSVDADDNAGFFEDENDSDWANTEPHAGFVLTFPEADHDILSVPSADEAVNYLPFDVDHGPSAAEEEDSFDVVIPPRSQSAPPVIDETAFDSGSRVSDDSLHAPAPTKKGNGVKVISTNLDLFPERGATKIKPSRTISSSNIPSN